MTVTASAAEKMDVIYRRQRFIYDATRRYYLFGRDRLIADLPRPPKAPSSKSVAARRAISSAPPDSIPRPASMAWMSRKPC